MTREHDLLNSFIGEWEGTTKTWFEPDATPEEGNTRLSVRGIPGGRFTVWDYTGTVQGKPHTGHAIYGFDPDAQKFFSSWVDSFHMSPAMMVSEGPAGEKVSVLGSYAAGPGPRWGWRTTIELAGGELVVRAFNIAPDGPDMRALETFFRRVAK